MRIKPPDAYVVTTVAAALQILDGTSRRPARTPRRCSSSPPSPSPTRTMGLTVEWLADQPHQLIPDQTP